MKNKSKAVTLVEVSVAIFVFMIGMLSLIQLYSSSLKTSLHSQNMTTASSLAQAKMEEVIGKTYEEITSEERQREDNNPQSPFYQFKTEVAVSYVNPTNNLNESVSDLGIKKVEVKVYWPEKEEKNLILTTLVSKR